MGRNDGMVGVGAERDDDVEELVGDTPGMLAYVEQAVADMGAASFLLDLAEKLEAWGHPDDGAECRRIAGRLQRGDAETEPPPTREG